MNTFIKSVMDRPAESGATLWWMGQMGFLMKIGDTVLCIDYYASPDPRRQVRPLVPAEEVTGIDAFLGTHNHLDHMDHASWRLWAAQCPGARFIYPRVHERDVLEDGVTADNVRGLNDGETCTVGNVTIHAIAAAHEFIDRNPETGLVPCLQYIIEGNGVRIYHAGDTLRYEGMLPALKAFGPVDAALLPINGRDGERYRRNCIGNMTYQEAADLAGELQPRMVIPGHWDMFRDNPGDPEAFADYLDAKYLGQIGCVKPRHGEPIRVEKEK